MRLLEWAEVTERPTLSWAIDSWTHLLSNHRRAIHFDRGGCRITLCPFHGRGGLGAAALRFFELMGPNAVCSLQPLIQDGVDDDRLTESVAQIIFQQL